MAGVVRIRIKGFDGLTAKLQRQFVAQPARRFLLRGSIIVQRGAREKAPKDRGGLTDSIAYEIDGAALPLWAKIGSNLVYAPPTEFGRPPGSMPPSGPLEVWARRHPKEGGYEPGDGYALALAIMRRGIAARPFLGPALDESKPRIVGLVRVMASEIEAEMAGGA